MWHKEERDQEQHIPYTDLDPHQDLDLQQDRDLHVSIAYLLSSEDRERSPRHHCMGELVEAQGAAGEESLSGAGCHHPYSKGHTR